MNSIRQYQVPLQKYVAMMDLQASIPNSSHLHLNKIKLILVMFLLFMVLFYLCCLQCMVVCWYGIVWIIFFYFL